MDRRKFLKSLGMVAAAVAPFKLIASSKPETTPIRGPSITYEDIMKAREFAFQGKPLTPEKYVISREELRRLYSGEIDEITIPKNRIVVFE